MKILLTSLSLAFVVCNSTFADRAPRVYEDRPFVQDYSEKIPLAAKLEAAKLRKSRCDRNGRILVLSDKGLLQVHEGRLKPDRQHRPLVDMQIRDMDVHRGQFVYLTDELVLSNAWAGRLLADHRAPDARFFAMGDGLGFMVGGSGVRQIAFDSTKNHFLTLTGTTLSHVTADKEEAAIFEHDDLTCFELTNANEILIGTSDGYLHLDAGSFEQKPGIVTKLPCADIRCIRTVAGKTWFGTPRGAFAINREGRIDYYASGRWLVDDHVVDIAAGPDGSVLVLSKTGLSIIHFTEMTLAQKATHFDRLTRRRHIRYGFNSAFVMDRPGDFSTGTLVDQDNDGLWTAMYLAGECFRYAVTKSDEALRNCYESFEAMERLTAITPMEGFPARSFDRAGYQVADQRRWQRASDKHWVWKATTSSDEIVGHFFVYAIFAEIVPDEAWRDRAVMLMDAIMDHIVRHDWYLVDYDGKPTLWGRWHPEYVNQFPRQVGDRRLNSVEIISFLQTAYHFTKKEIYKEKAFELFEDHGYLDNIMIPITEIGRVPGIDLTTEWNHSDDELAFLSYWILYRYAFNETLREQYREIIKGHWEIERPEKNSLWNFIYADTGAKNFDLAESIWSLREFPLDTVSWTVHNSARQDLEFLEANFRNQTTRVVLPPDERPMSKYNGNAFRLDGGNGGRREFSGDIYLLPYWMGRYLGIIR
ncbi:MAG: ligand-binding sensor domain-containing protein [Planctomycetota bacterium]